MFVMVLAGIILAIVAFALLMYSFDECNIGGVVGAVLLGIISLNLFVGSGEVKDLRQENSSVTQQYRDMRDSNAELQKQMRTLAFERTEAVQALTPLRAQLEAAKGNIEGYKSQVASLTVEVSDANVANGFLQDDITRCQIVKSELEGDLEVANKRLDTVRSLIKGVR